MHIQGDVKKLLPKFTTEPPFIDLNFDHFAHEVIEYAKNLFEAFKKYAMALKEIVMDKLPELFDKAKELPDKVEEIKDNCAEEFENLDIMSKGRALMSIALNIKHVAKVPMFLKNALQSMKAEFDEIKEAMESLKENIEKIGHDALKCVQQKLEKPYECYSGTVGKIQYTHAERKEWEKKMREKSSREGGNFNPENYPTTDMIVVETGKK